MTAGLRPTSNSETKTQRGMINEAPAIRCFGKLQNGVMRLSTAKNWRAIGRRRANSPSSAPATCTGQCSWGCSAPQWMENPLRFSEIDAWVLERLKGLTRGQAIVIIRDVNDLA